MPYVYNITISIDPDIEQRWLEWMRNIHIPEVMSTECFSGYRLTKLVSIERLEKGTLEEVTYAIQYTSASEHLIERYQKEHAHILLSMLHEVFPEKQAAFRTFFELIEEG